MTTDASENKWIAITIIVGCVCATVLILVMILTDHAEGSRDSESNTQANPTALRGSG